MFPLAPVMIYVNFLVTYFKDENYMNSFNGNYIDLTRTWEIFFTMVHYYFFFKKKGKICELLFNEKFTSHE